MGIFVFVYNRPASLCLFVNDWIFMREDENSGGKEIKKVRNSFWVTHFCEY
jgi:hypothetical protein